MPGGSLRCLESGTRRASVAIGAGLGVAVAAALAAAPVQATDIMSDDRPNLFGVIALPVPHTLLDAQWRRATRPASLSEWTDGLPRLGRHNRAAVLRQVNRWVNARVAFVDDRAAMGEDDLWSGAAETLRRGTGDCEDYALTKMQLLAALGFSGRDLYLVLVRDLGGGEDHAVLVVRHAGRFFVLDNVSDTLADAGDVTGYQPVLSFSPAGQWVYPAPVARRPAADDRG